MNFMQTPIFLTEFFDSLNQQLRKLVPKLVILKRLDREQILKLPQKVTFRNNYNICGALRDLVPFA